MYIEIIGLMTAALAVILKKENLAWVVFCIGFYLVMRTYPMDWVFGRNRPSRQEIEEMSAADYKKLLLNSKSKRWIDLLDSCQSWKRKLWIH